MNQYGKLFKKSLNKQVQLYLNPYDPDKEKYFEVIKRAKNEGLKQIIINSEIMSNIMFSVLESKGVILKISLSENTDEEVNDNIENILSKLRMNPLMFVKLKDELDWAMDRESIDISYIEIYCLNKKYQIFSNGIIIGENNDELFKYVIEPVVRKYFNGN